MGVHGERVCSPQTWCRKDVVFVSGNTSQGFSPVRHGFNFDNAVPDLLQRGQAGITEKQSGFPGQNYLSHQRHDFSYGVSNYATVVFTESDRAVVTQADGLVVVAHLRTLVAET